MIYLNGTFKVLSLDKQYSSKVFQPLLAMPHFSKVAVAEVFCKTGVLENFFPQVFFRKFYEIFKNTFFIEHLRLKAEAFVRRCSVKTVLLEISLNSHENICAGVSFLQPQACNFVKIDSLTQVFFCEFCKHLSKNIFFTEHLRWLFLQKPATLLK